MVGTALGHAVPAPVTPLAGVLAAADGARRRSRPRGPPAGPAGRRRRGRGPAGGGRPGRAAAARRGGRRPRPFAAPDAPSAVLTAIAAGGPEARQADLLRLLPAAVRRTPARATEAVGRAAGRARTRASVRGARPRRDGAGRAGPRRRFGRAGDAAGQLRRAGAALPGHPRAGRSRRRRRPRALPCAPRWPTPIRACARPPRSRSPSCPRRTPAPTLIAAAKQEPWPFVRRAELEALGHVCGSGAGDLMIRADREGRRRRQPGRHGRPRPLQGSPHHARHAAHPRQPQHDRLVARARRQPARGVGRSQRRRRRWRTRCTTWSSQSEADLALEGVAAAALRALARLGGPDALSAAVALAADTRHPFRRPALDALGVLCDPGVGRATLQTFASDRDPSLVDRGAGGDEALLQVAGTPHPSP